MFGIQEKDQSTTQRQEGADAAERAAPLDLHSVGLAQTFTVFFKAKSMKHHMNRSPPGSSVHGILQARVLEWAAMPSSRGSFQPRDQT